MVENKIKNVLVIDVRSIPKGLSLHQIISLRDMYRIVLWDSSLSQCEPKIILKEADYDIKILDINSPEGELATNKLKSFDYLYKIIKERLLQRITKILIHGNK